MSEFDPVPDFAYQVGQFLEHDELEIRAARLSNAFEVAKSTPYRWAMGTAVPHPLLQHQIIRWMREEYDS